VRNKGVEQMEAIFAILTAVAYIALPVTFSQVVKLIPIREIQYFMINIFAVIYFATLFRGFMNKGKKNE